MKSLLRLVLLAVLVAGAWLGLQAWQRHERQTAAADRIHMLLKAKADGDEQTALALWCCDALRTDEDRLYKDEVPFAEWWRSLGIDRPADWSVTGVELTARDTALVTIRAAGEERQLWVVRDEPLLLREP